MPNEGKPAQRTRNTVWITQGLYGDLPRLALDLHLSPLVLGPVVEAALRRYVAGTAAMTAEERPCFVGTLLTFPGAEGSKHDETGRRVELLKPGSRRLQLTLPAQLQETAASRGLVLSHQYVASRPADLSDAPSAAPTQQGTEPGRPLTDAVLTALVQLRGPVTDGPLAAIERQVITQRTAQQLWSLAEAESIRGSTQRAVLADGRRARWAGLAAVRTILEAALPRLLPRDDDQMHMVSSELARWKGTLTQLAETLQISPSGRLF